MIIGKTFDNQNVTPKTDGGFNAGVFEDGKIWGCETSFTASEITFESGQMLIAGRVINISGTSPISISPTLQSGYGRIVCEINLNNTATAEQNDQVAFLTEYSTTQTFSALTQEDINNNGAIYQQQILVFSVAGGEVSDIVDEIGSITIPLALIPEAIQAIDYSKIFVFDDRGIALSNGTDLNTVTEPGLYYVDLSGTPEIENSPFRNRFRLLVLRNANPAYRTQVAFTSAATTNYGTVSIRSGNTVANDWSDWITNVTSINGVKADTQTGALTLKPSDIAKTGTFTMTFNTDIVSNQSSAGRYNEMLDMDFIRLNFTLNGDVTANTWYTIATIDDEAHHPGGTRALALSSRYPGRAQVVESGEIRVAFSESFTANVDTFISGFWMQTLQD